MKNKTPVTETLCVTSFYEKFEGGWFLNIYGII